MRNYPALLALLLAIPAVAVADQWKTIVKATDKSNIVAYDPTRIRSEPPYLIAWTKTFYVVPQSLGDGKAYIAMLERIAVNCRTEEIAQTYTAFLSDATTDAPILVITVPKEKWRPDPVGPGSIGDFVLQAVCGSAPKR